MPDLPVFQKPDRSHPWNYDEIDMVLQPKDTLIKLEFDKVLDLIRKACLGDLGKEMVAKIGPQTDKQSIEHALQEVAEYKGTIEENDRFPMGNYLDISNDLKHLEVVDYVLPEEGLQRINMTLRQVRNILNFFNAARRETYPQLYENVREVPFEEKLIGAIERVIDEEGNIRPDASPALLKIRKNILGKQKELEKQFRSLIQDYRQKGWLTDSVESFRNGRRVLSVPAEHKRKIRGIIHDESATGKTAYIEPEAVIDINNDIFDLEQEEKREIYRILKELSSTLRPYVPFMRIYQELLIRFDLIQAKARVAIDMNAAMPKVVDRQDFGIRTGYHPLLLLKNKQLGKKTVPFDLVLHKPNRIVVLSGPNAGGKSITLKSVGLLQLMMQSGMLVPVDPESEMGIFQQLFADIGDQQSIEDDLSTYSSHLQNMRTFLRKATRQTLVLIDEFGSGTDPKMGGAIAESILRELNYRKVSGLITTHYSNLKIFAYKNKGIVNASMTFDRDTLSPTYEFSVGKPGSSYAFEIAHNSGLHKKVLEYAKHRTGKSEKAVDQLLIDLQREKQELEDRLSAMEQREQQLERLIKNYEQLHRELEFRRKKFKLESKQQALQQTAKDNKALERLVREIKEERNLQKAKEMAAQVKKERQDLSEEVSELKEEVYYKPFEEEIEEQEIKVGDHVKLRTGGATGTVESIDENKGKVVVQMGLMRMTANLRDLKHAKAPLDVQSSKSVQTDTVERSTDFQSKIDVRGMRMEEAMKIVENFIDQALISNATNLKIIHGKGNGVLRNAVRSKLREYDVKMDIWHPDPEQGGDGVTLVEIK
jgi:DNA mismatch repair protein MutS2